jgi:hypothetical protein
MKEKEIFTLKIEKNVVYSDARFLHCVLNSTLAGQTAYSNTRSIFRRRNSDRIHIAFSL